MTLCRWCGWELFYSSPHVKDTVIKKIYARVDVVQKWCGLCTKEDYPTPTPLKESDGPKAKKNKGGD